MTANTKAGPTRNALAVRACRARKKTRRLAAQIRRAVWNCGLHKLNGESFACRRTLALEQNSLNPRSPKLNR